MSKPFDGDGKSLRDYIEAGLSIWKKDSVQCLKNTTEEVIGILQTINDGKVSPLTIGNAAIRLTTEMLELYEDTRPRTGQSPVWKQYLKISKKGNVVISDYLTGIFLPYMDHQDIRVVEQESNGNESHLTSTSSDGGSKVTLFTCEMEEEASIYWIDNGYEATNVVCDSAEDVQPSKDYIADKVWKKYDGHIEININDARDFEFHPKNPLPWNYEGDQGPRFINRWRKFYDAGIRRSIILHGPPGTGKSTLARQVSKEIDGRVLFVPVRMLMILKNLKYFTSVVEMLQPDILIIDDIDRLSQHELDLLLSFFEENENPVPLLIATTNHLSRLPDAIKRPGRFDEIWRIDPPKDEIRVRVIRYLAELEGLELTDEQAEMISRIGAKRNLPGSHIREIVRRVAVLGWDEVKFTEDDLTFNPEWIAKDDPFDALPNEQVDGASSVGSVQYDGCDDDGFVYDEYEDYEFEEDEYYEEEYGETLQADPDGYRTWADIKHDSTGENE